LAVPNLPYRRSARNTLDDSLIVLAGIHRRRQPATGDFHMPTIARYA
jgi:hypothetical protein